MSVSENPLLGGRHPSWPTDVEAIIEARASGATEDEIGELLGYSARTVRRRLALPGVAAAITRNQADRVGALRSRLVIHSDRAIDVLVELLDSPDDRVRERAATRMLDIAGRFHHQAQREIDLQQRVEQLEAHRAGAKEVARQLERFHTADNEEAEQ